VELDASGSLDGDGDAITSRWEVVAGAGTLTEAEGEATSLIVTTSAPAPGAPTSEVVEVLLEVTDCPGAIDTDTVFVTVECTGL